MLDVKRKLDELIAIYSLEKDMVDVFVEGPTDKFIVSNYYDYRGIEKSVIEIDDIDLSELQEKYTDLNLRSNKDKLVSLSRILLENAIEVGIKCIVDRDFDGILSDLEVNEFIVHTDFSCMESYIFCKRHIEKLTKLGIRNFPQSPDVIINEISKVLIGLFLLRMVNKHFGFNFKLPKICNNMAVNKKTGCCDFDFDKYLDTYVNTNKLKERRSEIINFIHTITQKMKEDVRFNMNGHDFIEVLFNYINKIKNTPNFRLESFESAVYLSIQPNYLDEYDLFSTIC